MAKRFNALATEALTAAADDFLPLDGAANGTRKIRPGNRGLPHYALRGGIVSTAAGPAGTTLNRPALAGGTTDRSGSIWVRLSDWTPAANVPVWTKFASNLGTKLWVLTTGALRLEYGNGANFSTYRFDSTAETGVADGAWAHIAWVEDRDGDVTFYVNGAQLGAPVAIAAASAQTVTNTGHLFWFSDGATHAAGTLGESALISGLFTAAQVAEIFRAGGIASFAASFTFIIRPKFDVGFGYYIADLGGNNLVTAMGTAGCSHAVPVPTPAVGYQFMGATEFLYFTHRGLPKVYPEETMEAYRLSTAAGARFVEVDAQVLADGALAVMHDETLDRTTSSTGDVAKRTTSTWLKLVVDASSFLGGGWADLKAPMLDDVLREFGNKVPILLEAKSTGSGAKILESLNRYGIDKGMVLINSFSAGELTAAIAAGWITCLNLGAYAGAPTPATFVSTGYRWITVAAAGASAADLDALRAAGLKVALYTINTFTAVATYATGHADAVYTDQEIYLRSLARKTTDPFEAQTWYHGHQEENSSGDAGGRGAFYAPNLWGYNLAASNTWVGALQGWASPVGGASAGFSGGTVTLAFKVKFESAFAADRFAWIALVNKDLEIETDASPSNNPTGYLFLARKDGTVAIYWWNAGSGSTQLVTTAGTLIADGAIAEYLVTITDTDLTIDRTDVSTSATIGHTAGSVGGKRPAFLHAGVKGAFAKFSEFVITGP